MFAEYSALAEGSDSGEAWQRLSSAVDEAAPAQVQSLCSLMEQESFDPTVGTVGPAGG